MIGVFCRRWLARWLVGGLASWVGSRRDLVAFIPESAEGEFSSLRSVYGFGIGRNLGRLKASLIRCTTLGIRELPEEIDEVSHSFGASVIQTLMKVKIPMAIPAIMIGVNQGIMMALAMEVITPLIGGKGLGLEVFTGMSIASIGVSLQAGMGIVLLAIMLDRISQAWTKTQREAMGFS